MEEEWQQGRAHVMASHTGTQTGMLGVKNKSHGIPSQSLSQIRFHWLLILTASLQLTITTKGWSNDEVCNTKSQKATYWRILLSLTHVAALFF